MDTWSFLMVDFCEAEYSLLISPMFFTQRKLRFHGEKIKMFTSTKIANMGSTK